MLVGDGAEWESLTPLRRIRMAHGEEEQQEPGVAR